MAFERLQGLGADRFRYLVNSLVRGETAMGLARIVQQQWHEFEDVGEKTLTQQLNRLRMAAGEGMFGPKIAAELASGAKPQIKLLEGVTTEVIDRMEELAATQRQRYLDLTDKEKSMPLPTGPMLTATNTVFSEYRETLKDLQKLRFDLGLDAFKGPVGGVRGVASSVTLPDGTNVQRQIFEAVNTLEEIFAKRGVPPPTDEQIAS